MQFLQPTMKCSGSTVTVSFMSSATTPPQHVANKSTELAPNGPAEVKPHHLAHASKQTTMVIAWRWPWSHEAPGR